MPGAGTLNAIVVLGVAMAGLVPAIHVVRRARCRTWMPGTSLGMTVERAGGKRTHRAAGFTLIELLVVLAILGLIVALVTPQVLKYLGRAKTDTARIEIQTLGNALDLYRLDMQRYPTQEEGLAALVEAPPGAELWRGPYLKQRKMPLDPWGRPYIYRSPGEHGEYDLYTLGADNAPGGSGENQDVTNW